MVNEKLHDDLIGVKLPFSLTPILLSVLNRQVSVYQWFSLFLFSLCQSGMTQDFGPSKVMYSLKHCIIFFFFLTVLLYTWSPFDGVVIYPSPPFSRLPLHSGVHDGCRDYRKWYVSGIRGGLMNTHFPR